MNDINYSKTENAVEIRHDYFPPKLFTELRRRQLKWTRPLVLLTAVHLSGRIAGVFGDPDNGSFEWFVANNDGEIQETSNFGWGNSDDALLAVVKKVAEPETT